MLFSGCVQKEYKAPKPPTIAQEQIQKPKYKAPGSLYNGYDNLFSDAKAYNVGDIITIVVNENIKGAGTTNTKSTRSNSMDLSFPAPTVMDKKLPKKETLFGLKQSSTNTFKGQGGTNRSAKLLAKITARVVKVYPNGNLYIVGKKYVTINNDTQYIKISGIVNPQYVNADNTIDSSKVADMYVEYNGKGFMNTTQRPGWLAQILMKIWPF
ncbi:flagellar L-ring protein precursor FlgH [Nitratiruptor sp. YY09-18]|nr:flagellar L-ring protein precursor FlgH [Nitratiruptor sp. YY09-18]